MLQYHTDLCDRDLKKMPFRRPEVGMSIRSELSHPGNFFNMCIRKNEFLSYSTNFYWIRKVLLKEVERSFVILKGSKEKEDY